MRELRKEEWAKAAEISNLLRAHTAHYQFRVKDDYIQASSAHLIDFPIKAIKAGLDSFLNPPCEKFPTIALIIAAVERKIIRPSDQAAPGFTKDEFEKKIKEDKDFKSLEKKMVEDLGEENLSKYLKYYYKTVFGPGIAKELTTTVGESGLARMALFDLRDAEGDPERAVEIAAKKEEILTRERKRLHG